MLAPGTSRRTLILGAAGIAAAAASPALNYRPSKLLIHHTVEPGNTADRSRERAIATARQIQNAHIANGWGDSGQHFTISQGGYILEGRRQSLATLLGGTSFVQGTHCLNFNSQSVGIENEGDYRFSTAGTTSGQTPATATAGEARWRRDPSPAWATDLNREGTTSDISGLFC